MKMHLWMLILTTAVVAGCESQPKTPSLPGPVTQGQLESLRQSYRAQNPKVQVGVVVDVLETENLVAVTEVDVSLFHAGDTVCFMDSASAPLVCGKVVRVTGDQVHVKYEAPAADRRAPMKGDVAVAFH